MKRLIQFLHEIVFYGFNQCIDKKIILNYILHGAILHKQVDQLLVFFPAQDDNGNIVVYFIDLSGAMQVPCDRCLEYFSMPVQYNGHMVVRFSESEKEPDEEVIWLHPEDYEIGLAHYLYECLSLSIPIRKVHPDLPDGNPGCDPEMLKKLDEYLIKE